MHLNSQLLLGIYAAPFFKPGLRVLEVGPTLVPSEFHDKSGGTVWEYTDIKPRAGLSFVCEPYQYPVRDNAYDIVFSANVLEHVPAPWKLMAEWGRITKPGGHVITAVPVSWPFHEWPHDCWRIYPEGMRELHAHAGLTTVLVEWGSGEQNFFKHTGIPEDIETIPGRSYTWLGDEERQYQVQHGYIEVAFDTIGIAQK